MTETHYPFCIEQTEDGYFYAYLTQNPSCYAYGETEEEAYEELYNIADEQNAEYCALRDWY